MKLHQGFGSVSHAWENLWLKGVILARFSFKLFLVRTGRTGFSFLVCVAWVAMGNGFSRTICKRQCGAPSCGVHVRLPPVATEGEAQFVSRSTFESPHHLHRMRRRFRPQQPRRARFLPSRRRLLLFGHTQILQSCPVSETHCRGRRRVPRRHRICMQSQGRAQTLAWRKHQSVSPPSCSGSVGSRQPRRRTPQSTSGGRQATVPRSTCGGTVGFVSEVCGTRPWARGTSEKNRRGSTAGLGQLRVTVGPRVEDLERLRAEARACPVPPPSHNEPASETTELRELRLEMEQLKRERNQWMGKTNNSQAMEVVRDSRSSRMASLIRRSRREAPLCRAVMRQHVECAEWYRSVHSRNGLRRGEASHPGPGSRVFAHRDGHQCGG